MLFSLEESWVMIGMTYNNYFDTIKNELNPLKLYFGNIGGKISTYKFWDNKNVGLFLSDSITVPVVFTTESSIYDYNVIQNETIIGFGFRKDIFDRIKIYYAIGFDFIMGNGVYNQRIEKLKYEIDFFNFGIAGDIGIKINLNKDKFFISSGLELTYHFINHTSIASYLKEDTRWMMNSLLGVKPYICFGVNFYTYASNIGVP